MTVEGKDVADSQSLDHREARGVGQREVLIVVLIDDLPSAALIPPSNPDHRRVRTRVDFPEYGSGNYATASAKNKRMGFGNDKVRREGSPAVASDSPRDGKSRRMLRLSRVDQREGGGTVDEHPRPGTRESCAHSGRGMAISVKKAYLSEATSDRTPL